MIYKKQKFMCCIRNEKQNFLESIESKKITNNKTVWKTVKLFISNKCHSSENIISRE